MKQTPEFWSPTFNLKEDGSIPTQAVDVPAPTKETNKKTKPPRIIPSEIAIAPNDLLGSTTLLMVIAGLFANPILEKIGASDLYWITNTLVLIVLSILVKRTGNRLLLIYSIQWAIALGISNGASVLMNLLQE